MNPRSLARIGLSILLISAGFRTLQGQDRPNDDSLIREVQVGISGVAKIGHWTPVRIQVDAARLPSDFVLELMTIDSDAVPVVFRTNPKIDPGGWIRAVACFGRWNAGLTIRLSEGDGREIAIKSWGSLKEIAEVVSPTEQILLQLGPTLSLQQASPAGSPDLRKLKTLVDPSQLPTQWLEYDSIDLIILTTGGTDAFAQKITTSQATALWRWVEMGGRILLSTGENAAATLGTGSPLEQFSPGPFRELTEIHNSDSLEFYAGSAAGQLIVDSTSQGLRIATFESPSGLVEVRQNNLPLTLRRSVGFGEIIYSFFDLEQPLIAQWKGNSRLLNRLMGIAGDDSGLVKATPHAATVNYGFRDLSGQVRATGERFRGVSFVTFMLIAALIVLYAICLGPLDYFVLKKLFHRMEWTWVTSTIITLIFAGVAWGLVSNSKPREVLVNHTEIVDIDAAAGAVRGGIWTNIYSPKTQTFDVALPDGKQSDIKPTSGLISSFGMPGDGIGGMESRTITRMFRDPYTVPIEMAGDQWTGRIDDAPVAVASTKQFFAKWAGHHEFKNLGEVVFRETGRQMGGTIQNPFEYEIREAVLLYGNTVYMLGDIPPLGSVELSSGRERSLKFFLQSADAAGEGARWSVSDRGIPRVFGMLMFFRVAGGEDFTGLSNRFQNEFDLSGQLALGQAIFLGRIDGQAIHPLAANPPDSPFKFDRKTSFFRIVFPVQVISPSKR